jgi:hypothetical protein
MIADISRWPKTVSELNHEFVNPSESLDNLLPNSLVLKRNSKSFSVQSASRAKFLGAAQTNEESQIDDILDMPDDQI